MTMHSIEAGDLPTSQDQLMHISLPWLGLDPQRAPALRGVGEWQPEIELTRLMAVLSISVNSPEPLVSSQMDTESRWELVVNGEVAVGIEQRTGVS